jgi:hypothetical protein
LYQVQKIPPHHSSQDLTSERTTNAVNLNLYRNYNQLCNWKISFDIIPSSITLQQHLHVDLTLKRTNRILLTLVHWTTTNCGYWKLVLTIIPNSDNDNNHRFVIPILGTERICSLELTRELQPIVLLKKLVLTINDPINSIA